MMNLETYLRNNCERNVIDHALRAEVAADGTVSFYIHPANTEGETLDYKVATDTLTPKFDVAQTAAPAVGSMRWVAELEAAIPSVEKARATFADKPEGVDYLVLSCALNDLMAVLSEHRGCSATVGSERSQEAKRDMDGEAL